MRRQLYHLVFFSRHELPNRIWGDVAQGPNQRGNLIDRFGPAAGVLWATAGTQELFIVACMGRNCATAIHVADLRRHCPRKLAREAVPQPVESPRSTPLRRKRHHMIHRRADADPLADAVVVVAGHVGQQRLAAGKAQRVQKLRTAKRLPHDLRLHR